MTKWRFATADNTSPISHPLIRYHELWIPALIVVHQVGIVRCVEAKSTGCHIHTIRLERPSWSYLSSASSVIVSDIALGQTSHTQEAEYFCSLSRDRQHRDASSQIQRWAPTLIVQRAFSTYDTCARNSPSLSLAVASSTLPPAKTAGGSAATADHCPDTNPTDALLPFGSEFYLGL